MPDSLVIRVCGLCKSIGEKSILEDINMEIRRGEFLSIVGSSGCGKTVLTKHFNGLNNEPDSGKVYVFGRDLSEANEEEAEEIRKRIGYVFQANALFSSSDVYQNISLPLREDPFDNPAKNEEEIRRRVISALESVRLGSSFSDRMPTELSGGEKKRVAIARAIVAGQELMIYDEPTTGLDPQSSNAIISLIENIHTQNGATSIAVTHDKNLMKASERIIFLHDKRVYFDGASRDFFYSGDEKINEFLAETKYQPA